MAIHKLFLSSPEPVVTVHEHHVPCPGTTDIHTRWKMVFNQENCIEFLICCSNVSSIGPGSRCNVTVWVHQLNHLIRKIPSAFIPCQRSHVHQWNEWIRPLSRFFLMQYNAGEVWVFERNPSYRPTGRRLFYPVLSRCIYVFNVLPTKTKCRIWGW